MARDGCRPRFARLAASPLPRECIALTKSEEKERLLAVYYHGSNLTFSPGGPGGPGGPGIPSRPCLKEGMYVSL